MRKFKRSLAFFLAAFLIFSDVNAVNVFAWGNQEEAIAPGGSKQTEDAMSDSKDIGEVQQGSEDSSIVNAVKSTREEETGTDTSKEAPGTDISEEKEQHLIQYLMLEQSSVELNGTQKAVIGIDCDKEITEAVLKYHNQESGEEFLQKFSETFEGAILFEMLFVEESLIGTYQLDEIRYCVDGITYTQSFANAGIEAVFGVGREVVVNPDAFIEDGENDGVDIEVIRIDEDGNITSENSLEAALQNTSREKAYSVDSTRERDIIVVLDPGHDEKHIGAHANGIKEEEVNLKIAMYCKEELESYNGVKVYMTRDTDNHCPYPGTTSAECNERRVTYAKSVGADIFVSLHNNSAENSSANGAIVYYPNSNYNPSLGQIGKDLAQKIEDHLVALGLYNRGITIRNSSDYVYADGSTADYYAVIRNCKKNGIPAIIVEHAFLTNSGDVNNFLSSDQKLKALGVADATAIAEYFGLSKSVSVTAGTLAINNVNNEQGTALMTISNVTPIDKISKVSFAVWSKADQSDLVWYDVANNGTSGYQATLDISRHQYHTGTYYVDAYAYDIYGGSHYLGSNVCVFNASVADISIVAAGDATQSVYWIGLSNVMIPGVVSIKFAVWSDENGQDDLIWYDGTKAAAGSYSTPVLIANHGTAGVYYADAYAFYSNGQGVYLCSTLFEVDALSGGKVSVANENGGRGTFDVVVEGISTKSAIQKVQVPVWSKSDQSDLYWYTAEKLSDGKYVAHVNIANHKYNYGLYYADAYVTAANGLKTYAGGVVVELAPGPADVYASGNSTETVYSVNISDLAIADTVWNVKLAVWSETGGQDDLVWYNATSLGNGNWSISIPIANHKTAGNYYADAYVENTAGSAFYVGGTQFEVSDMSPGKVQVTNKNEGAGQFDVIVSEVNAKSGIGAVSVPVWCSPDQSDIYWYVAVKQSDGSYIAHVDLANHKYNYGLYYADVYATGENGVAGYVGGATVTMNVPEAVVMAEDNGTQTWFALTATNVGIAGGVSSVSFAVWSEEGGQDDLIWYDGVAAGSGIWQTSLQIAAHKTAGTYYTDVYAKGTNGQMAYVGGTSFIVDKPSVESVSIVDLNEADGTFGVKAEGIKAPAGVSELKIAVWSAGNQSDLVWYQATANADGTYQIGADIRNHQNNTGKYYADAYLTDNNGISVYAGGTTCTITNVTNLLHPLMGSSSVTVAQMAAYFNAHASYPVFYASTEAPTIEAFCSIYLEECRAEGVKAEVAFCQAMKETGYLKYGGNVSITQYNFGGIGSTAPGVAGESYPSVRIGIRAQVQHLKAYGNKESLNGTCVDSRFQYVTRGCAPYVEWLGINENPEGKGWATAKNYGYDIVGMVNTLKGN